MLRDYEIPLLEEMLQEEKYQENISLSTSFVKDFLEEYSKLEKALDKACEKLEESGWLDAESGELVTKEQWKKKCIEKG